MSDWTDVCDAIIADLLILPDLGTVTVHRYATWDPQILTTNEGRCLAVFPLGDAEAAEMITNWDFEFNQVYVVMVWEPSPSGDRQKEDEEDVAAFLDLQNAIRARFLRVPMETAAMAGLVRYVTTQFPETAGPTRWFRSLISVRINYSLSDT